jgi:hypothetical protein
LNFIKSLFYSWHGLSDSSLWFILTSILGAFDIPISERHLFVASGVVGILLIVMAASLLRAFAGPRAAWLFVMLATVSPMLVFIGRTGYGRIAYAQLLLAMLFLAEYQALRMRSAAWGTVFLVLCLYVPLTESVWAAPLIVVLAVFSKPGGLMDRLTAVARDRILLTGLGCSAVAIVVGITVALVAKRQGHVLTLWGYIMYFGNEAPWRLPTPGMLSSWAMSVDQYFPFRGAWIVVGCAALLATAEGLRGRLIGFVAVWWWLASFSILVYIRKAESFGIADPPTGQLSAASFLLVPSLFLVAWVLTALADDSLPGIRIAPAGIRGTMAIGILVVLVFFMGREAHARAFRDATIEAMLPGWPVEEPGLRRSACRAVKGAGYYLRSRGGDRPFVFHHSSDVTLAYFAEFYYGLSYSAAPDGRDPNRLFDFGQHVFHRRYRPAAFLRPLGRRQFDYYIDFVGYDYHGDRPFANATLAEIAREGARVVCRIRDGARVIAQIWSFHDEALTEVDYVDAARRWDLSYARPRGLLQQPLAGTIWHFPQSWRQPDPASGFRVTDLTLGAHL